MFKISVTAWGVECPPVEVAGLQEAYAAANEHGDFRQEVGQLVPGIYTGSLWEGNTTIGRVTIEYVPELLTTTQAAERLGCSARHVARLADQDRIPVHEYVGVRGDRRFNADVIAQLVTSRALYRRPEAAPTWPRAAS